MNEEIKKALAESKRQAELAVFYANRSRRRSTLAIIMAVTALIALVLFHLS